MRKQVDPDMPLSAVKILVVLTALLSIIIVVANLSALKLWTTLGVAVDGGLVLFPVSYVAGDLLVEIYGRKTANHVALTAALMGVVTTLVFALVAILPDYPGADNTAFYVVNQATGRVFLASICGFVASQVVNNYVFDAVLARQRRDSYIQRAFVSSLLAHLPDILLFEPIAFFGRLTPHEFFTQAIWAYLTAVVVETVLMLTFAKPLAGWLALKAGMRHGRKLEA